MSIRQGLVILCALGLLCMASTGSVVAADYPHHQDPDEVQGDGNEGSLQAALGQQLAGALENSSVALSKGQYAYAQKLLGDAYQQRLEEYVDLAGDGDRTAETIEETVRTQQRLAQRLAAFNETLADYRAARNTGNETRARALAHELVTLRDQIRALGGDLQARYGALGDLLGIDIAELTNRTEQTVRNTSDRASEIANSSLVETTLVITAYDTTGSYTDPITIQGQLLADGDPVVDARIMVENTTRSVTARTDGTGHFELSYRPILYPAGEQSLTVRYHPSSTVPYQAATVSRNVTITQTSGTLAIKQAPSTVAFGETLNITVGATAAGEPIPNLSVPVRLGEMAMYGQTNASGLATATGTVNATVPPGTQQLTVAMYAPTAAVAFTSDTAAVTVPAQDTNLTVATTPLGNDRVQVTGTLTTAAGTPVGNVPVTVAVDGDQRTTVETNAQGQFETTIAGSGETVTATYAGTGASLTESTTTAPIPEDGGPSLTLLGGVAVVGVLVVGGGVMLWRRQMATTDAETATEQPTSGTDPAEPPTVDRTTLHQIVAEDPTTATKMAYAQARRTLLNRVDAPASATHWEFYHQCQDADLGNDTITTLETLTEQYERAVFAAETVDADTAQRAVRAAERIAT